MNDMCEKTESRKGRYGEYGGQYIPETLMCAVHEVEEAYERYRKDPEFIKVRRFT